MKSRNSRASKNKREVNDIKSANSLHAPPTSGEPKYMRTRSQLSTQLSSRRCLCPSNGQSMRWILGHCRVTGQQRTNRCTMLSRKVRSQIFTSSRRRHPLGAEKDLKSHRPAFLETDPRGDSRSIILTATRRSGPAPPASTLSCTQVGGVRRKRLTRRTTDVTASISRSDSDLRKRTRAKSTSPWPSTARIPSIAA